MAIIKILAVEDDPIYAGSLGLIIEEPGYELVGIADNAEAALQLLDETLPDLVLTDIEINDSVNRIELTARIIGIRK